MSAHIFQSARDDQRAIGIDIGKTKIAVGIVTATGVVEMRRQQPTKLVQGAQAILFQCSEMVQELISTMATPPCAIGIGSAGMIDHHKGRIVRARTIPGWQNIDLRYMFEKDFGLPVAIDNDVYAAALGERHFGAARFLSSAVYITISSGIGFAILKEGVLWRGHHELAGHITSLPLLFTGKTVNEAFSGTGIANRMTGAAGGTYTTADVFRLLREGDPMARSIINEAINDAALCVAWIQQCIDPESFIFGGSVALAEQEFVSKIQQKAEELLGHYMTRNPEGLKIVLAALGGDSTLVGAGILGFQAAATLT